MIDPEFSSTVLSTTTPINDPTDAPNANTKTAEIHIVIITIYNLTKKLSIANATLILYCLTEFLILNKSVSWASTLRCAS